MKKFPKFDAMIAKPKSTQQTWKQQLAVAHMWAAIGRGKISKRIH